jgi:primosomal protein N' (replication factor Y) (superfamily II helicase)
MPLNDGMKQFFAQIAVNIPSVAGVFDYAVPQGAEGRIGAGHLVTVPFGRQIVQGVVVALVTQPSVAETKPILELLDPIPVLTGVQIELAKQMAGSTINSLAAMIDMMLPSGLSQQADQRFEINGQRPMDANRQWSAIQTRIIKLLSEKGSLRGRQIDRHFSKVDWRKTAQTLVRSGVITSQSVLPAPTVRPKFVRTAQLAVPPEQAEAALPDLGKTEATRKRRETALRFLLREPEAVNVAWVYADSGCNLADLQELDERGLIVLRETEIWRDPLGKIERMELEPANKTPLELTSDQQKAWEEILTAFQSNSPSPSPFLLHGVTGSGKTELYLRAAAETIRRGKQAIILVPEIAITPQMVRRFLARFPGQVGLIHSRLSEGERYDTWRRARLGLLKVVIGPRSAIFAPMPNIGLIVADECHDGSYYQSDPPFYHAVEAAKVYARLCGAVCILGSATPSILQRYLAESRESVRLELPKRIRTCDGQVEYGGLPPVSVIDMREELKSGRRGIFSQALVDGLEDVLRKNQQAILFLNRRGTATYVFCRQCGTVAKCPQCDTPLTYHVDPAGESADARSSGAGGTSGQTSNVEGQTGAQPLKSDLRCHRCGYIRKMPEKCPHCHSNQMRAYGLGSEKVEAEAGALFPSARVLRWDWETTRQKDAHEIILSHFAAHRADVLVGTQMLAKGLDLPLVTLVGIVLADVGLNLPDPFATERTFSLLTQVAGRAGRSALGGRVVLQTFQPEHYAIQAAARHDYDGFYARELDERRKLGYPPFSRLVRLEYRDFEPGKAEAEARALAARLSTDIQNEKRMQTDLIGPVPGFYSKVGGWYRWQIVVRGPNPADLVRGKALPGWRVEVDPVSLL